MGSTLSPKDLSFLHGSMIPQACFFILKDSDGGLVIKVNILQRYSQDVFCNIYFKCFKVFDIYLIMHVAIFNSPEPKAQQRAYSIDIHVDTCRPLSSVGVCVCVCVCQDFQLSSPLKPLGRLKGFKWSRWSPCPHTINNLLL